METSYEIRQKLIDLAELDDPNHKVLEPSAGNGFLIEEIHRNVYGASIWAVELNKANHEGLTTKFPEIPRKQLVHGNFLDQYIHLPEFDRIIAVPPYKDSLDCKHISCMYALLKPGGILVSLSHPQWMTGTFSIHSNFRKWINDKDFKIIFVEDESYMNTPKIILKMQKPII